MLNCQQRMMLSNNWNHINYDETNDTLCDNKQILLDKVASNGHEIRYASETLRNDTEIVYAAFTSNWRALQYASNSLRNNKDFMLSLIQINKLGSIIFHIRLSAK